MALSAPIIVLCKELGYYDSKHISNRVISIFQILECLIYFSFLNGLKKDKLTFWNILFNIVFCFGEIS